MIDDALISRLVDDIRIYYLADPSNGQQIVADYLKNQLAEYSPEQARVIIQRVIASFTASRISEDSSADKEQLIRVFGLLLGRKVTPADLSSDKLLERMAKSLSTTFDILNQLINDINLFFSDSAGKGEQTIRQFIGFHSKGEDQTRSLEAYLKQISNAFLATQKAFKATTQTTVGQILDTLDPTKLAAERRGGLKIGPMRKAEDFDILKEKIEQIKHWFDSGRFMEDYLKEFENNCQKFNST